MNRSSSLHPLIPWPLIVASSIVVTLSSGCYGVSSALGEAVELFFRGLIVFGAAFIVVAAIPLVVMGLRGSLTGGSRRAFAVVSVLYGLLALAVLGVIIGPQLFYGEPLTELQSAVLMTFLAPCLALVAVVRALGVGRTGLIVSAVFAAVLMMVAVRLVSLWPGERIPRAAIVEVIPGGAFDCLRFDNGKLLCLGSNREGQLGLGHRLEVRWSRPVIGLDQVADVVLGAWAACARRSNGDVYCWGKSTGSATPRRVGSAEQVVMVALPSTESDHRLRWQSADTPVLGRQGRWEAIRPGFDAPSGEVAQLVAGPYQHDAAEQLQCARGVDGSVMCRRGAQGVFAPVTLRGAVDLVVGQDHACVLLDAGSVHCWHYPWHDRTRSLREREATAVAGLGSVVELVSGSAHLCVRNRAGKVLCWGRNDECQLGTGRANRGNATAEAFLYDPAIELSAAEGALSLRASATTTCAISKQGEPLCWGRVSRRLSIDSPRSQVRSPQQRDWFGPVHCHTPGRVRLRGE